MVTRCNNGDGIPIKLMMMVMMLQRDSDQVDDDAAPDAILHALPEIDLYARLRMLHTKR